MARSHQAPLDTPGNKALLRLHASDELLKQKEEKIEEKRLQEIKLERLQQELKLFLGLGSTKKSGNTP